MYKRYFYVVLMYATVFVRRDKENNKKSSERCSVY